MEALSGQNSINTSQFFSHCCSFHKLVVHFLRRYTFFLRWLLIIFSDVHYFNLSLDKFFIGSPNEFFHSYC